MKLLIIRSSPDSRHFLPLRSKFSHLHHIPKEVRLIIHINLNLAIMITKKCTHNTSIIYLHNRISKTQVFKLLMFDYIQVPQ
jgi:hypothetical protein